MHRLNAIDDDEIAKLRTDFNTAMMAARDIFGPFAFRKRDPRDSSRRLPINKALFETVSVNLAADQERSKRLIARRDDVNAQMNDLMNDPEFRASITLGTGGEARVRRRFGAVDRMFDRIAR
jgi:hypothetical protein